jgi:hypothetical protein
MTNRKNKVWQISSLLFATAVYINPDSLKAADDPVGRARALMAQQKASEAARRAKVAAPKAKAEAPKTEAPKTEAPKQAVNDASKGTKRKVIDDLIEENKA